MLRFPEGDWVQLTLFEPQTLYIAKTNNGYDLIGCCRNGIINWIKEQKMYAYPITEEELRQNPELLEVKRILIRHKKKTIGFFCVSGVDVVVKPELNAYNYPTRSSRHKSDTKYLIYTLSDMPGIVNFNELNFQPIIGKGVNNLTNSQ